MAGDVSPVAMFLKDLTGGQTSLTTKIDSKVCKSVETVSILHSISTINQAKPSGPLQSAEDKFQKNWECPIVPQICRFSKILK